MSEVFMLKYKDVLGTATLNKNGTGSIKFQARGVDLPTVFNLDNRLASKHQSKSKRSARFAEVAELTIKQHVDYIRSRL